MTNQRPSTSRKGFFNTQKQMKISIQMYVFSHICTCTNETNIALIFLLTFRWGIFSHPRKVIIICHVTCKGSFTIINIFTSVQMLRGGKKFLYTPYNHKCWFGNPHGYLKINIFERTIFEGGGYWMKKCTLCTPCDCENVDNCERVQNKIKNDFHIFYNLNNSIIF
jgi:hypothetical protein